MLEKSHPLFLFGFDRTKRRLSAVDNAHGHNDSERKRLKKSESTVQVPVPVKPVAVSSGRDTLGRVVGNSGLNTLGHANLAAAHASLHRPRLNISTHTVTSNILNSGLAISNALVTRAPLVTGNPVVTNCPVKLYPWKPNMYIV